MGFEHYTHDIQDVIGNYASCVKHPLQIQVTAGAGSLLIKAIFLQSYHLGSGGPFDYDGLGVITACHVVTVKLKVEVRYCIQAPNVSNHICLGNITDYEGTGRAEKHLWETGNL